MPQGAKNAAGAVPYIGFGVRPFPSIRWLGFDSIRSV